jgi:hypothetical protein
MKQQQLQKGAGDVAVQWGRRIKRQHLQTEADDVAAQWDSFDSFGDSEETTPINPPSDSLSDGEKKGVYEMRWGGSGSGSTPASDEPMPPAC